MARPKIHKSGQAMAVMIRPIFQQKNTASRTRSWLWAPKFCAAMGSKAPVMPSTGSSNICSSRMAISKACDRVFAKSLQGELHHEARQEHDQHRNRCGQRLQGNLAKHCGARGKMRPAQRGHVAPPQNLDDQIGHDAGLADHCGYGQPVKSHPRNDARHPIDEQRVQHDIGKKCDHQGALE